MREQDDQANTKLSVQLTFQEDKENAGIKPN